jgi:phage terminase small subunit
MARPRKPTNVLTLSGSFVAHPERARARADEPEPVGEVGEPPAHLSPEEKAAWREIVDMCPPGVLALSDRLILEHGSRLLAQLRKDRTYVDSRLMLRLEGTLGRLGLTPADRSRVAPSKAAPAKGKPLNRFAAIADYTTKAKTK